MEIQFLSTLINTYREDKLLVGILITMKTFVNVDECDFSKMEVTNTRRASMNDHSFFEDRLISELVDISCRLSSPNLSM